jgi:hypothetical protein
VKKLRPLLTAVADSAATWEPVASSTVPGRTLASRACSSSGEIPAVAATRRASYSPGCPSSRSASACGNATMLAPPKLSFVPNPMVPLRTTSCLPLASRTVMRSPTWNPALRAVPMSRATCPWPTGALPSRTVMGDVAALAS